MTFLRTGQYLVAYPKQDAEKSAPCCAKPAAKKAENSVKKDVESLFNRIEKEMGVDPVLSKDELNLALNNTIIKATSSIHNDDDDRTRLEIKQPPKQQHNHDHDHGHDHDHHNSHDDDDFKLRIIAIPSSRDEAAKLE